MDNNTLRKAIVLVGKSKAGYLKETDNGYSFIYDKEYLTSDNPLAVSLTLPLTETEYESKTLFPFFDGLIPEGWLLEKAIKKRKLSSKDRFGLLLAVCKDCVGDVSILCDEDTL